MLQEYIDEQDKIAKARKQLHVERANHIAASDARWKLLESKDAEIDAWDRALTESQAASCNLDEMRKIVGRQEIEVVRFRSTGRRSLADVINLSSYVDKERLEAMSPEERHAEREAGRAYADLH